MVSSAVRLQPVGHSLTFGSLSAGSTQPLLGNLYLLVRSLVQIVHGWERVDCQVGMEVLVRQGPVLHLRFVLSACHVFPHAHPHLDHLLT